MDEPAITSNQATLRATLRTSGSTLTVSAGYSTAPRAIAPRE